MGPVGSSVLVVPPVRAAVSSNPESDFHLKRPTIEKILLLTTRCILALSSIWQFHIQPLFYSSFQYDEPIQMVLPGVKNVW
jgi:hypothetical protein